MEAHVVEEAQISERDVNRVEREIRHGGLRADVFPGLSGLATHVDGTGPTVKIRITRNRDALPVRYATIDEHVEAAAIREVDLQNTYRLNPKALAEKLKIDTLRAKALRWELGIEDDTAYRHDFVFGRLKHTGYSDAALDHL